MLGQSVSPAPHTQEWEGLLGPSIQATQAEGWFPKVHSFRATRLEGKPPPVEAQRPSVPSLGGRLNEEHKQELILAVLWQRPEPEGSHLEERRRTLTAACTR